MVMASSIQPKKKGNISKNALYLKVAHHASEMIQILLDLARNGDNDNVKMGAAKVLLNKCIPDLKAMEIEGGGNDIKILVMPESLIGKYGLSQNTINSSEVKEKIPSSKLRKTVGEDNLEHVGDVSNGGV